MNISRVRNTLGFENAVREYVLDGIHNPVTIAELLGKRGVVCSAVAVQLCFRKLLVKATAEAMHSPNNATMNLIKNIGKATE